MMQHFPSKARTVHLFFLGALCSMLAPAVAVAATRDVSLSFRPHCVAQTACPVFSSYDEESMITNGLVVGDMLDLDIVVENLSKQALQSIRSWLEYDPRFLEGVEVRVADTFPLIAPGEQGFDAERGLVKLGASNVSGGMEEASFVFARVQFRVLAATPEGANASLRFHEFSTLGQDGKTEVLLVEEGRTTDVLAERPRDLRLYFGTNPPRSLLPQQPTSPPPPPPPATSVSSPSTQTPLPQTSPADDASFAQLQPQGIRVMTEGENVFLVWGLLTDPRVAGYNVYYGTISGRYIQRRTLSAETMSVTIRQLPKGERYYFAVTAFDAAGQDSEFSYEVAVTVGDSASSTAPFIPAGNHQDGLGSSLEGSVLSGGSSHVPGGTGLPFIASLILLLLSLLVGGLYTIQRHRSLS